MNQIWGKRDADDCHVHGFFGSLSRIRGLAQHARASDSRIMNETGGDSSRGDGLPPVAEQAVPPSVTSSNDPSSPTEDPVTRTLRFLSTASTETLGGIAVGIAACTYLVLGKLGLILIGAFGGVVLHATWEGQSVLAGNIEESRREKGLDVIKRILDLRDSRTRDEESEDEEQVMGATFEGFQPETQTALKDLVDAVIRDYVKWWYNPILPKDLSFPAASRQTLTKFILAISQHLSRKRPADTFLDFLTNSSSIVIVFLNELSTALSPTQGTNVPTTEAVYTYLSANPESNLANILNEKQQTKKFKLIAEDILQNFLEKNAYDCDPARTFLREILAGIVLEMTLKSCSKPEWLNGWIVYLLEEGEPDISQAIDAGMGTDLSSPFHDLDGNMGNINLAKVSGSKSESQNQESKKHKKRLSKAEEAMEEAMEEAKRLSQLIAEEEAKNSQNQATPEETPNASGTPVEQNAHSPALTTALTMNGTTTKNQHSEPLSVLPASSASGSVVESPISPQTPKEVAPLAPQQIQQIQQPQHTTPFTSFDQIVPAVPLALSEEPRPRQKTLSLTLVNANIIIHDDSTSADKGKIRNKPTGDYLVQIEPASSDFPGWMIVRKYPDFEKLHEVLRRIAQISGVAAFTEQHNALPNWKEHTKPSLRGELERYLREACWHPSLAESEGMKRFLEKDQEQTMPGMKNTFTGIPNAFESMGKGMLDVLASAPKGVAEGGKAIGGGISGVFTNIGNLGQKRASTNGSSTNVSMHTAGRASTSVLPRMDSTSSIMSNRKARASEDSLRASPLVQTQPQKLPDMERRPSYASIAEAENEREPRISTSGRSSMSGRRSTPHSRDPSRAPPSRKATPLSSPTSSMIDGMKLPPPPSTIRGDYSPTGDTSSVPATSDIASTSRNSTSTAPTSRPSTSTAPSQSSPSRPSLSTPRRSSVQVNNALPKKPRKDWAPLDEPETRVAVELLFAVISELYTLSSAWKFRRTLLNAAKTFLLRPGNPSLSSIQSLIQDSVIASNTSDAGIASHIRKLRENTMPTEEELKAWPAEMTMEEKERLRIKARKLLVERGVPAALTGVMGQAATGEAMGRVFDCLQIEEVNRGLMFGMLLQCVRAVTH
ncbi:PXA domain-containing protein [Tricladium varicosporioides]|nr:PXA domain-containing protein [Hymenoscyphus varicosporioides]